MDTVEAELEDKVGKKGVEEAQLCVSNPPDKAVVSVTLSCPFLPR